MQKKTRNEAGTIGQVSAKDNTAVHHIKPPPKKHRARCYMMRTGIEGWTENDILKFARLSSGRNYATELERLLNIRLERIDERNPDNIGSHFRYRFVSRHDVLLVIQLVNYNALYNGHQQLTESEISDILYLYPDTPAAA
ncbi:hypothetical protein A6J66_017345 [Yersinia enterocolitica]|nr:hypothetical protein A6J66_017345 [Yersinia enterocolitica]